MELNKTQLSNKQILTPVRDLNTTVFQPIIKDGNLGKYVFLYDYQKEVFTPEAEQIMKQKGEGVGVPYNLPKGSFYNLKFSKGDVVDVVDFKKYNNDKGVPVVDKKIMVINVPKYVKPIGGNQGFQPTIEISNYEGWLQKVLETTPLTTKLGIDFGTNINPATKPILDNPATPTLKDPPVVVNGVEDISETKGFFDDKNNLLTIAGVLLIGYLLLTDKSE